MFALFFLLLSFFFIAVIIHKRKLWKLKRLYRLPLHLPALLWTSLHTLSQWKNIKFFVYISVPALQQPGAEGVNLHVYFLRSTWAYLATQASKVCFFHGSTNNVSKGSGSKWVSDGRKLSVLLYIPQASNPGSTLTYCCVLDKILISNAMIEECGLYFRVWMNLCCEKLKCSVCSKYRSIIR